MAVAIAVSVRLRANIQQWNQFFYYVAGACIILSCSGGILLSHTFARRWVSSGTVHLILTSAFVTNGELAMAVKRVRLWGYILIACVLLNLIACMMGVASVFVKGQYNAVDAFLVTTEYALTQTLLVVTNSMMYVLCVVTTAVWATVKRFNRDVHTGVYTDCKAVLTDYMYMYDRIKGCIAGMVFDAT